jgi:hypothetical protein
MAVMTNQKENSRLTEHMIQKLSEHKGNKFLDKQNKHNLRGEICSCCHLKAYLIFKNHSSETSINKPFYCSLDIHRISVTIISITNHRD